MATSLLLTLLPGAASAAPGDLATLPACSDVTETSPGAIEISTPWQAVLDDEGVVVEHRMTLRRHSTDLTLRTGRRGFAAPVSDSRVLIGERSDTGTTLTMVDVKHACQHWHRQLDRLAYDAAAADTPGHVRLALHDRTTRWFEGFLLVDSEHGGSEAMIDGECSAACQPNDGDVDPAAFGPTVAAKPVPAFASGGWARGTSLAFRWQPGEVPPTWAREDIRAAADDASDSSAARSPRISQRGTASDTIRYTSLFPTFCRYGIACASRDMPTFWSVWLRPHGTDFSWGSLQWCQKDPGPGCFDLRRVVLHELGHVVGLDHPSNHGFRLEANETVMHAITPARPSPGSSRHDFGRCDVATLQELYDVPTNSTPISTCNDVATRLALRASSPSVSAGASVRLTATLRIADLSELGLLAGNVINGRSVKLWYRRAGSSDSWTTVPMEASTWGGRYVVDISPEATWEFRAVFRSPREEGLHRSASRTVTVELTEEQPTT